MVANWLRLHHNEDECSYVPTGTLGALPGDDVVTAEAGFVDFHAVPTAAYFWGQTASGMGRNRDYILNSK